MHPLAAELGASFRRSLPLISREMDRAALPVVLAAGISAPSGMLTCPDLNSPLEAALYGMGAPNKSWIVITGGKVQILLHGQAA